MNLKDVFRQEKPTYVLLLYIMMLFFRRLIWRKSWVKGSAVSKEYRKQAVQLRQNMDSYFAAEVEGFDTYAYYKGNDVLRAWICIPLTVGINERAKGTIDALFSPRLWTDNGLLTAAGSKTFGIVPLCMRFAVSLWQEKWRKQ